MGRADIGSGPDEQAQLSRREARLQHAATSAAPRRRPSVRGLFAKLVPVAAMLFVGGLMVSTSIPASAVFTADNSALQVEQRAVAAPVQEMDVADAVVPATAARDSYTVELPKPKIVPVLAASRAAVGIAGGSYTNDPNGTIQWPFPVTVPIASGFGARQVSNCGYCTTFHEGLDFTPGSGVEIQAIADGVVAKVGSGDSYGNSVWIDHVINGQHIVSGYAHMLSGSVRVSPGQAVTVGTILGQVGSTGASTGAHLHLEIHLDGTPIDPYAWLKANAN
ncbi:M23 family metallopeptidase [Lacisediminihabitans changchengi]|uniref:M23 family metallopeptidase n=1 Tax=Lacisediminihabitans changchengi TaxID=2787634 RepID=A0A934SNZ6_9MICO|nr:M23 family metallopeptidase [Lacisediminihabitans changchengi]MBK4349033.1 M23 family metallopeptidase [Lacisediminihabitans changchengi]